MEKFMKALQLIMAQCSEEKCILDAKIYVKDKDNPDLVISLLDEFIPSKINLILDDNKKVIKSKTKDEITKILQSREKWTLLDACHLLCIPPDKMRKYIKNNLINAVCDIRNGVRISNTELLKLINGEIDIDIKDSTTDNINDNVIETKEPEVVETVEQEQIKSKSNKFKFNTETINTAMELLKTKVYKEVSQITGISVCTLYKYAKRFGIKRETKISDDKRAAALELLNTKSYTEVSQITGISVPTLSKYVKQFGIKKTKIPYKISDDKIQKALDLLRTNTYAEVSQITGISVPTLYKYYKKQSEPEEDANRWIKDKLNSNRELIMDVINSDTTTILASTVADWLNISPLNIEEVFKDEGIIPIPKTDRYPSTRYFKNGVRRFILKYDPEFFNIAKKECVL